MKNVFPIKKSVPEIIAAQNIWSKAVAHNLRISTVKIAAQKMESLCSNASAHNLRECTYSSL